MQHCSNNYYPYYHQSHPGSNNARINNHNSTHRHHHQQQQHHPSRIKQSLDTDNSYQSTNSIHSLTGDLQRSSPITLISQDQSSSNRSRSNCNQGLIRSDSNALKGLHIGYTLHDTNDRRRNESPNLMNSHYIPQPNIMPRPNSLSNVSINGRIGIVSSPRGNGGSSNSTLSFTRSHMSAFSSPNKTFADGSSPVPSIIASECSDGTFPSRTPSFNFNDFDQSVLGYEQWGSHGAGPMNMKQPMQISPRISQGSYFARRKASNDLSYFTPIHDEPNEATNCNHSSYYVQDQESGFKTPLTIPEGYFPQCQEVPRSISMKSPNAVTKTNDIDQPMFCMPVGSTVKPNITQFQRPNNYHSNTLRKNDQQHLPVEQPLMRTSKKSTDSTESILTSFKSLSSDESTCFVAPQLPQNLKGDPHRQAKVKTELCLHYARGKVCPYGPRCNYAHGEHELKYTKLFELRKAGLVEDISTYRCHPCASWVATGACPFGLRCHNLHDPRIASTIASWLPHSDIPVSTLQTELTVDKSYHQNQAMLNQDNPLVHNLLWAHRPSQRKNRSSGKVDPTDDAETEWKDTYSLVCNMANLHSRKKAAKGNSTQSEKVSELEKLCIAMKMSYSSESKPVHLNFVYKAKYTVYNELCMVLQTKYFLLLHPSNIYDTSSLQIDSIIREITSQEYEGRTSAWNKKYPYTPNKVVAVKELTFGCLGEPSSKVSLWFDLPDPILLSNQEIKRFKRNRQRKLQESDRNVNAPKSSPFPGGKYVSETYNKSFESHPHKPFFHMRPVENDTTTLNLIKDILNHRILVLQRKMFHKSKSLTGNQLSNLEIEAQLESRFQRIKNDMLYWQWPVSKGRETINANTSVPSCGAKYHPSKCTNASKVWESFLQTIDSPNSDEKPEKLRLAVFSSLSNGVSIKGSKIHVLPHIKSNSSDDNISDNEAWKYISGASRNSEWNLILAHYLSESEKPCYKDTNMPLSPPQGEKLTKN